MSGTACVDTERATGDRDSAGNFSFGVAEQPPGTPRIIRPGAPDPATLRQLKRAAQRVAGHFGVRVVDELATFSSGVYYGGDVALGDLLDLKENSHNGRGGLRDCLDRLIRGGVLVRFHAPRAKGARASRGQALRVLVFGDPVEGGAEMRRPSWVDDRGAALSIAGPGGQPPRTLRIGADLVEIPARPARVRTIPKADKSCTDTIELSCTDTTSCSDIQTDLPQKDAPLRGADAVATREEARPTIATTGSDGNPTTTPGISTTPMMGADPAPGVPFEGLESESAHGSTADLFATVEKSPTIAPTASEASPDLSNGANVAQKSRRSKAPKSPRPKRAPKVDTRTEAEKAMGRFQSGIVAIVAEEAKALDVLGPFTSRGGPSLEVIRFASAAHGFDDIPEHWRGAIRAAFTLDKHGRTRWPFAASDVPSRYAPMAAQARRDAEMIEEQNRLAEAEKADAEQRRAVGVVRMSREEVARLFFGKPVKS